MIDDGAIYLAGPLHECDDFECLSWRREAAALLGGRVLDPCRRDYRGRKLSAEQKRQLVDEDLADVKASVGVLAHCWKSTTGTAMEIVYAKLWRKPVVVVIPYDTESHPWLQSHADFITDGGVVTAVNWLKERLRWQ